METRSNLTKQLSDNKQAYSLLTAEREGALQKIETIEGQNKSLDSERERLTVDYQDRLADLKPVDSVLKQIKALDGQRPNRDLYAGLKRKIGKLDGKLESLGTERKTIEDNILELDHNDSLKLVSKMLSDMIPALRNFRILSSQYGKDSFYKVRDFITEISLI